MSRWLLIGAVYYFSEVYKNHNHFRNGLHIMCMTTTSKKNNDIEGKERKQTKVNNNEKNLNPIG